MFRLSCEKGESTHKVTENEAYYHMKITSEANVVQSWPLTAEDPSGWDLAGQADPLSLELLHQLIFKPRASL